MRPADRAIVDVTLHSEATDASAALDAATVTGTALQRALERLHGIRISGSSMNLSMSFTSVPGSQIYAVTTSFEVTLDDLAVLPDATAVVNSTATAQQSPPRYEIRKRNAAAGEALAAAVADAKMQADALAAKSTLKIAGVRSLQGFVSGGSGVDRTSVRIDATAATVYEIVPGS